MPYTYTNQHDGQVIESSTEAEHLEGQAIWVRTGEADTEGKEPTTIAPVLKVSSPSGSPEESASGGPFPTGKPDPEFDVNVPSPDEVDSPETVLVKAPNPDPNFDAGDGRKSTPVDLLGTPESKIVNQANDEPAIVTLEDLAKVNGENGADTFAEGAGSNGGDPSDTSTTDQTQTGTATEVDGIGEDGNVSGGSEDDGTQTSAGATVLERPAKNGSTPDWLAFARQEGLTVEDNAKREDLIAAVEAHDAAKAGHTAGDE